MKLGPALVALSTLALCGCNSLSEEEQTLLDDYKLRSKQYFAAGHLERARGQCSKGLTLAPDDTSLLQVLGFTLLRQTEPRDSWDRRLQEAAFHFEHAIEVEEEFDYRNRTGLGEVLTKIVMLRLAKVDELKFDSKMDATEKEERVAALRADIEKRSARAREVLQEVLGQPRTKENDLALSTLARLESQLGGYDRADALLTQLIAVLTRSAHIRGQQLDIQNWPAETRIAVHEDISRIELTRVDALKLRTNVLAKMGRDSDVISTYAEIEALKAMQPADYFNRAVANERIGSIESAIADYDKFITLAAAQGSSLSENVREAMDRKAALGIRLRASIKPSP